MKLKKTTPRRKKFVVLFRESRKTGGVSSPLLWVKKF